VGAFLVAFSVACGRGSQQGCADGSLRLADFVFHQAFNVTTEGISVPNGVGLDRLSHGWRIDSDSEKAAFAVITGREAQVSAFSADGSFRALELELALAPDAPVQRRALRVYLNGQRVGRLRLDPAWAMRHLDLESGSVRIGENFLTLEPGVGRAAQKHRQLPSVRLRRLRLLPKSGRALRAGRPDHIRVHFPVPGGADSPVVVMPTESFLDLVLRLPSGAQLTGEVGLQPSPNPPAEPVVLSVRLLDETGSVEELFVQHLRTAATRRTLKVNLGSRAGQIARLRFAAIGHGESLVQWRGVCVQGASPVADPTPGPPVARVRVAPSGDLGRPDVLLILLDAARADAFSPFGGPHETLAAERLAASGTVFRQATTPSSWTGQSVPAIFTGLFPDTLGVGPWGSVLPEKIKTLAEMTASVGYRTVLWSQHPIYRLQPSLARGFEITHAPPRGIFYDTLPAADDLLSHSRPTFAFVHLIPPHQPYTPPAPYRGRYSNWYEGDVSADEAALNRLEGRPERPNETDLRYIQDRYLENAAYADHLVGRLLSVLDRRNRYRDALVVLLADHGEAFYEHGHLMHSRDVHREVLHVPLILKWPESIHRFRPVVDEPVSLVDLVPTLVEGLALAVDTQGYQGRSLLPLALGDSPASRAVYAVTRGYLDADLSPRSQLMLESEGWRILYRPLLDESQLYRVESDPQEQRDVSRRFAMRTLLLRQAVLMQRAWDEKLLGALSLVDELGPKERAQLRALGYLE
jgi:arylsulfatase A-like enzyme